MYGSTFTAWALHWRRFMNPRNAIEYVAFWAAANNRAVTEGLKEQAEKEAAAAAGEAQQQSADVFSRLAATLSDVHLA